MSDSSSTTARVRPASPAAGSDFALADDLYGVLHVPRVGRRTALVGDEVDRVGRVDVAAGPRLAGGREVEAAVAQVGVNEVAYREAVGGGRGLDEEALEADGVGVGSGVRRLPRGRPGTAGERSRPARERAIVVARRADGVAVGVVEPLAGVAGDVDRVAAQVPCRLHIHRRVRPG